MFNNSSIFILSTDNKIYRLEVDKDTQKAICETFSSSIEFMVGDKTLRNFDWNYKPEDDELLRIENFQIQDDIKDAIRYPLGVTAYNKSRGNKEEYDFNGYPKIKAIFVGTRSQDEETEHYNIAFQKYRKEQNLTALAFCLFFSTDTFRQDKRFGIGVTENIDCYYIDGELQFNSFYYARQVFDLSGYYRTATDNEVKSFTQNLRLEFENAEMFEQYANTYIRRKIAMINDSKVLDNHEAIQIKNLAKQSGIDIKVSKKKLIIPANKDEASQIIAFLDEEAYRGPFSQNLILANSKRVIKNNT